MLSRCSGTTAILATSAIFLFMAFPSVNGIKCYQCNSVNNSACTNLERYSRPYPHLEPTECVPDESHYNATGENVGQEIFCRKSVYGFEDNDGNYFFRTVRGCAWVKHNKPCYTVVQETQEEIICQCSEDGCNGSGLTIPTIMAGLFIPTLITLYQ